MSTDETEEKPTRWQRIKADPVLLERERARIRRYYAASADRRKRQRETGKAWRERNPGYSREYMRRYRHQKQPGAATIH